MLFFGPGDFSQAIGAPGDMDHPKIQEARKKVVDVARKYGKFAGTTGPITKVAAYQDMGYQFISIGADVLTLTKYCADLVAGFGNAAEKVNNEKGYYGAKK